MKKYAQSRKWSKEKPTVVRATDQGHILRGLKESAKIVTSKLPWFSRGKRSWEK